MSSRSIRRAAERAAFKQSPKRESEAAPTSEPAARPYSSLNDKLYECMNHMSEHEQAGISASRLAANRANALLSTGPTTSAGKRIASANSLKTGLTGRTVLLPSDDIEAYQAHLTRFQAEYKPATEAECEHVQTLADTRWRLNRIPTLEAGIFLRGRLQFADTYAAHAPAVAAALADTQTLITYEKQLRALHTQESRLTRTFTKELAALEALQAERQKAAHEATAHAETEPAQPTKKQTTSAGNALAAATAPYTPNAPTTSELASFLQR